VGTRFSARPDRPWSPLSLLYNGYRVFPGSRGGRGVGLTHQPHLECRGPRKSRAVTLLTLRDFVDYKKGENLPTFSMTMRNKQRNFPYLIKTRFVFIGFTRHTQRNVFETGIINYCVFIANFFFFFCNKMLHCSPGLSNNAVKKSQSSWITNKINNYTVLHI